MSVSEAAPKRKTKREFVLASMLIAIFIAAIEGTIVATAIPSIVASLGGFSLFSWVFSSYLLMQTVTIPIYGKMADLFGRRPVFVFGVAVFLIGSLMCGLAETMLQLIVFRFVQGFGAGAIQPIAMTVIGDIYPGEERGRVQGYISGVWGLSSVIGPAAGGLIVQYFDWAWIFWLNIPVGVLAVIGAYMFLHEHVEKKKRNIDFAGAALLFCGAGALLLVLVLGGVRWPWLSGTTLGMTGLAAALLLLFLLRQRQAAEPIMPLSLWQNRMVAVGNLASLSTGIVMMGYSAFLPTHVQGVMALSPTAAGFVLAMMSIGWMLASTFGGRALKRVGYRPMAISGGVLLAAGSAFFLLLKGIPSPLIAGAGSLIVGAGMGLASTTFIVAIQTGVDWNMRGAATASNMFMRVLGTTVGAALLAGIMNTRLLAYFRRDQGLASDYALDLDLTNRLLDPHAAENLPASVTTILQNGLADALHVVYLAATGVALLSLLLMAAMPSSARVAPRKRTAEGEGFR